MLVKGSLRQKGVLPAMDTEMDPKTKEQVMAKWRRHYAKAGPEYKRKLLDEAVRLFGYHRKAAIRALRARPAAARAPAVVGGRPREHQRQCPPPHRLFKIVLVQRA